MRVVQWVRMVAVLCVASMVLVSCCWRLLTHNYSQQLYHNHNLTEIDYNHQDYYNSDHVDDKRTHTQHNVRGQGDRDTISDSTSTYYQRKFVYINRQDGSKKVHVYNQHSQIHDKDTYSYDKNSEVYNTKEQKHDKNNQIYVTKRLIHDQNSFTIDTSHQVDDTYDQTDTEFVQGDAGDEDDSEEEEQGEKSPRVILLLGSWRSGSTFLGELLATAVQDTFYSYEPLHPWKIKVLYDDDNTTQAAVTFLKDLFHCRLEQHEQQVSYMASQHWYLRSNTRLASHCHYQQGDKPEQQQQQGDKPKQEEHQQKQQGEHQERQQQEETSSSSSCFNASFVSQLCRSSRLHVAKVLRLGLQWVVPLLEEKLDLQVVYLVRDPRAVLSSRERVSWCSSPTCRDPAYMCPHLYHDLLLLPQLRHLYPDRFKMVLYESLLKDINASLRELYSFLRLPLPEKRLLLLTASSQGSPLKRLDQVSSHARGTYGTTRMLDSQAYLWRFWTPYKKMVTYQTHCSRVIRFLRLRLFTSSTQYHSISRYPVLLPRPPQHALTS
ncbi:carbohydrate sulfotransferase 5-like isoform X2 [Homarus americanus]|nr:carbohydrate sulfotransferase 5-like isoform X2 [Homarus americanus]